MELTQRSSLGQHAQATAAQRPTLRFGQLVGNVRMHRLSFTVSSVVAGVTLGLLLIVTLAVPGFAWWWSPVLAFAIGGVTYLAVYRLLVPRLALAASTLKQIRKRQFDNLEAAHVPRGDELNDLIWQVYRTGQTVQREMEALKEMESYRREFLGNVSHELKTPIFSIRGFAETLRDGALEDERVNRGFLEKILNNSDRLSNLAQDLAEISRMEMGELEMKLAPFDLRRVANDVVESLEPITEAQGVTVTNRVPGTLPPVVGDAIRIRQVLVNLVENAIKYNDAGGYVDVVARLVPTGEVKVSIVDDGIGIAPDDIPRLTERFYRVDKSRSRAQGGTGLGLAIVKHILNAHSRTLMISSTPERGSTFGFTLPTDALKL